MLRLLTFAIATRLGIASYPCPYCGDRSGPTRWPWQGVTRHVLTAH